MLKIRLQRSGRKNTPFYRIVVAEHTKPVKGRFVERLGHYDPKVKPKALVLDDSRFWEWVKRGAKPSSTLARLLKGKGLDKMDLYIEPMKDRRKKGEEAATAPAGANPPAPEAAATPAPEAPQA